MKKLITIWNAFSALTLLILVAAAFWVVFPVQAQAGGPTAPTVPAGGGTLVVPPSGTVVVPNTGAPASSGALLPGLTLVVILVVVVVVVLLARGSRPPAE